jgi:hypothetical protein
MIYVEPVKTKSPKDMIPAFNAIFERVKIKPWSILTDKGWEFEAKSMQKYWEEMDILKYTSENPILHATMAERAIRTLKERTTKWMSEHSTKRWIDNIQEIASAINHTIHTTTKMRPVDVNYENGKELYENLYETSRLKNKSVFKIGDTVRIESYKGKFAKGKSNFTDEIFVIDKILDRRSPVVYRLKDSEGEEIKGLFYNNDLCKASPETTWRVEILKTRTKRGIKEFYVHWIGYNDKKNSWIPETDLV